MIKNCPVYLNGLLTLLIVINHLGAGNSQAGEENNKGLHVVLSRVEEVVVIVDQLQTTRRVKNKARTCSFYIKADLSTMFTADFVCLPSSKISSESSLILSPN